jgi:hypothetical protein
MPAEISLLPTEAAADLPSKAAVRRLVSVTLAGLRPGEHTESQ